MDMLLVQDKAHAPALFHQLSLLRNPEHRERYGNNHEQLDDRVNNASPISHSSSVNEMPDNGEDDYASSPPIEPLESVETSFLNMSIDQDNTPDIQLDFAPVASVACQRDFVLNWLDEIYKKQQDNPNQAGTIPFDLTLLEMYKDDINTNIHFSIPTNLQAEISLMNDLNQRSGVIPKYTYDKFMAFLKKNVVPNPDLSKYNEFRTRDKVMKDILKLTSLDKQLPKENEIHLPNFDGPCKVTTFDFHAVLYDMLTDPLLDKDSAYIFKSNSPLTPPEPNPTIINDIDTGWRYIRSWSKLQTSPDVLPLPIITFIDKANLTSNDRLSMEAVMLQLGLHNRDTRNKFESFRNLGMMPRLEKLPYKDTLAKLKDYHFVLSFIFEKLQKIMSSSSSKPLLWVFRYKGFYHKVILSPYILLNIGDTVGHNAICGKASGNFALYKCRYCMCPTHMLGNPMVTFRRILREDYVRPNNTVAHMKTMSMHLIDLAFEKLEQGDNPHGTLGLCLGEIVHAIQGGWDERLIEGTLLVSLVTPSELRLEKSAFISRCSLGWYGVSPPTHYVKLAERPVYKAKAVAEEEPVTDDDDDSSSGKNDDVTNDDDNSNHTDSSDESSLETPVDIDGEEVESDSEAESEEETPDGVSNLPSNSKEDVTSSKAKKKRKKNRALGGVHSKRVDNLARRLGRDLQHQSYRDIPPCYFSAGISTQAKTSSSEKAGILLLYLIIFCSNYGQKQLSRRLGPIRMAYMIECIENALCLEEFMKDKDGFFKSFIPHLKAYIPEMKQMFRFVVNRQEGEGLNLTKVHISQHIPDDVSALGSPANVSGSAGEMNQKIQKAAGRRTAGNAEDFDQQLSINTVHSNAIRKAYNIVTTSMVQSGEVQIKCPSPPKVDCDGEVAILTGQQYVLRFSSTEKPRLVFTGKVSSGRGKVLKKNPVRCLSEVSEIAKSIIRYASGIAREHRQLLKSLGSSTIDIMIYTRAVVPQRIIDGDLSDRYFLYADPFYVYKGISKSRNDWGFFKWEQSELCENDDVSSSVPAKALMFMKCTVGTEWFFGQHAVKNGDYALINSLFDEPSTYFDLEEEWIEDDWLHPASRLLFRGKLEMETPRIPMCRLVDIMSLQGPATVIRDFDPVFFNRGPVITNMLQPGDSGHEHIIMRPRRNWSDVFRSVGTDTFGKTKRVAPNFVFS
jgi:hypothetical protein